MPSFNLIDEPWIPCILRDGETYRSYGLRDTLLKAPVIRELSASSPLATMALHRLLLAILHRVFGPRSVRDWRQLWERGAWDPEALGVYLEDWRERFDLFHPTHPFYQDATLKGHNARTIAILRHDLASGNNATLFDHTVDHAPPLFTPSEAAIALLSYQSCALGGLVSFEKGQDRRIGGAADAAPLAKGAVGLFKGNNLFETLMLNLVRYDGENGHPFCFDPGRDRPVWERDEPAQAIDRCPYGYLDWLTWLSRRVCLIPETNPDGPVWVRRAVAMKGCQLPAGVELRDYEPMLAFRAVPRPDPGQSPWRVIGFQEGRALWRDSLALVQSLDRQQQRPKTADWLAELIDEEVLQASAIVPTQYFGLCADRAKPLFWRHERLPLSLRYLSDKSLCDDLRVALRVVEQGAEILRGAIQLLALLLVAPSEDPAKPRKEVREAAQRLSRTLAAEHSYWPRLDAPFKHLLVELAGADGRDPIAARRKCLSEWAATVERVARQVFEDTTRSLDMSAHALKAVAMAERKFRQHLHDAFAAYREQVIGAMAVRR